MSTLFAHLRKEWRDQRAILVGIAVAIPLLLVAGLWLLGDTVSRVECATPFIVAGAVALPMLALSTELFAGESRRNTQRFLRRLPLGLLRAWAAKTFFYFLVVTVTAAYAGVVFLCVAALFGGPERAGAVEAELTGIGATWLLTGAVVAVGLWVLLVSTWIPKGGAAAGVALLLLGGIAAPVYLTMKTQPHFLLGWSAVPTLVWAFVLAPLLLSAWCWCRGARFATGLFSPVVRGLPAVLLLAGGGLAYGSHAFERWMDLDPRDPDCRISQVLLGENERFAFVNAYRADARGMGIEGTERPWAIDLATHEVRRLAPPGHSLQAPVWGIGMGGGRPCGGWKTLQIVATHEQSVDAPIRWVDADTATIWKTLSIDVQPPELLERLRDEARRHTPVRLADGRRAWILTRWTRSGNALHYTHRLERDTADGGVEGEDVPESMGISIASRFGWVVQTGGGLAHVSGEAGSTTESLRLAKGAEHFHGVWLSPRTVLVRGRVVGRGERVLPWRIQDVGTGEFTTPEGLDPRDAVLYATGPTRVLVFGPGSGQTFSFAWVDTTTGDRTPLEPLRGAPIGTPYAYLAGVLPSGAVVVAGNDASSQSFCGRLDVEGRWDSRGGWAHGQPYFASATDRTAVLFHPGGQIRFGPWRTHLWTPLLPGRP